MIDYKLSSWLSAWVVLAMSTALPCHALHRVFLLGGQSNMVGQGVNSELVAPYDTAQNDVNYWNGAWVPLAPGFGNGPNGFGPEIAFGRAIKDALPADTIYLVKYAVNGTALFNDWNPTNNGAQYIGFMDTVHAALANLETNGINYEIAGMLWMQGESDAYEGEAASYETHLTHFIQVMRSEFNTSEMPFIIARVRDYYGGTLAPIVGPQTEPTQAAIVRAAQVNIAESSAYVSWFDTDAYQMANLGHYGTQGQLELGDDFAAAILADPILQMEVVGSDLIFAWESMVGADYTLFGSDDLAADPPVWSTVASNLSAALPNNNLTNALPAAPAMFYRVKRNDP